MKVTIGRHAAMDDNLNALREAYTRYGIEVTALESATTDSVFHRDVMAWTPFGLIKSRMGKESRAWEPDAWFDEMDLEPAFCVESPGTFEGADLLWLDETTCILGCGDRTDPFGYNQVADWLKDNGVTVYGATLPRNYHQHLLGLLNALPESCHGPLLLSDRTLHDCRKPVGWGVLPAAEEYKATNFVVRDDVVFLNLETPKMGMQLSKYGYLAVYCPCKQFFKYQGGVACASGIYEMSLKGGVARETTTQITQTTKE